MRIKSKLKAIELFNANGVANVSMKQIADSLSISAGNLSYHYKNKAVLLASIFEAMYTETLDYILPNNTYITLFHFEDMMLKFSDLQQRYSFFFNDLVHIIKSYPKIAGKYETSNLIRFKEARKLIDYYIESKRLKPESDIIDYNKTIHAIWMTSTFWQAQKIAIDSPEYIINKCQSIEMIWSFLLPNLTSKGMEEYNQLRQFVKLPN